MDQSQSRAKWRRRVAARVGFAALLLLSISCFIWGKYPDPRFQTSKLIGLTPEEVIQRLGPPRVDPRIAKPKPYWPREAPWSPDNEAVQGPLRFYYYDHRWMGFEYGIIFEHNRVSKVMVGSK